MNEKDKSKIINVNITEEMKKSYLDYAMTVIVSRALPDVRDGLKPVHRRILYSASELGLSPDKPHKKSARIVGDVLGKYHPHGDSAVYDAMVRLAQSFSMRYPLIDGHGNFGSVDGDEAAAMRYTEARMSSIAMEMLRDLGKDTVDFRPNFDETLKEPVVLPSRFPNLLVNGSSGIAVGMASSIPPHNIGEVINGIIAYIDNPDIDVPGLMRYIKGPDFPTGAIIEGKDNIKNAYMTGRGILKVKAKAEIEEMKNSKSRIVVSELPYQVNKARLIEKIAELVRDKRIDGISDIRDESDRTGMRIVIEIKRDYNPNIVLNQLYKHTQLQDSFSVIMIALVDNEPKVLNLKEIIYHYVNHQRDVIVRRTRYDLGKAEARAHIVEGLLIAIDNIDEVIRIIRSSYDDAEKRLMEAFKLTEIQTRAIVDMRLRRLQGLEREKLNAEYEDLIKMINRFKEILANQHLVDQIIKDELKDIKNKFYDERKTQLKAEEGEINEEDLIEEENVAITLTHFGYIKRLPEDTYKAQNRGGKGITALTTRDEDFVTDLFITSTHDYLLFVTNKGKIYKIKAYEVPEARRQAKGTAVINLINIEAGEKIKSMIPIREFNDDEYLVFVTKNGIIKKTKLSEFESNRKTGLVAIKIAEDDELISMNKTDGTKDIFIVTKFGKGIRFHENDVRDMGRNTMGVRAITLEKNDELVAMSIIEKSDENKHILTITEKGYAKITLSQEYRPQNRGGKGMKAHNINKKTGSIVNSLIVKKEDDVMILSANGTIIRMHARDISVMGRDTQGVIAMRLKDDDKVDSIAKIYSEEEDEE
jgi:DNA gyrase subunit A